MANLSDQVRSCLKGPNNRIPWIPQAPSGRWKGRIVVYDAPTGKRRELTHTFDTKKDAKNWAEKEAAQYREDPNREPPSEETVGEYLIRWFPQMIGQRALRQFSIARHASPDKSGCRDSLI